MDAGKGVARLLREEANAKLHAVATLLVAALGIGLDLNPLEWAILTLTIAVVWACEAMNSAIERLADHVSLEKQPLIGAAKDLAAAAVLLASLGAVAVAASLLGTKLWLRLRG